MEQLPPVFAMEQLPPDLLVMVLNKVFCQKRLGIASLVCKSWRNAALIALKQLYLVINSEEKSAALSCWLKYRTQHLQHLQLVHIPALSSVHMPWDNTAQLRSLLLCQGTLTGPSSKALASLQQTLTSLVFVNAALDHQALSNIAALTNLRYLRLDGIRYDRFSDPQERAEVFSAATKVWSSLVQLTALTASGCGLGYCSTATISLLRSLRELYLSGNQVSQAASLSHLPSGLTLLNLRANHSHLDFSEILPQPHLRQLQHLVVSELSMSKPSQLAALTCLTYLQADDLAVSNSSELLAALPSLKRLQHLQLQGTFSRPGEHAVVQELNAALRLPELTLLDLDRNSIWSRPTAGLELQPIELQNQDSQNRLLFSSSSMPKLREISLDFTGSLQRGTDLIYDRPQLQMLVYKCPGLQDISISGRLHQDCSAEDLRPLSQLSSLTGLALGRSKSGLVVNDDIIQVLASLASLKDLTIKNAFDVTDLGLMSLTKLNCLTHLAVLDLDPSKVDPALTTACSEGYASLRIWNKGLGQADAWQQLVNLCKNSPLCEKERHKQMFEELKAA